MPATDPTGDPAWKDLHSGGCMVQPEDRYCRACQRAFVSPEKSSGRGRPVRS